MSVEALNNISKDMTGEEVQALVLQAKGASVPTTITPGARSVAYDAFQAPIMPSTNGFDFHIYHMQNIASDAKFAKELHEKIIKEFPELRTYPFWDKPVGPHPTAMFEVDTFNPHQTGALFSWLVVNRGPCSVLVHPNTGNPLKDHTELATWIGKQWPLDAEMLKSISP
ncbi:hypothetical protein SERLA73DRAFT_184963 [Serpula lacrymans var. lacrymans S7.3]|uniref:Dopa 4,5-dioxygenase n=2 Tax=Serpula lacrymans var. lacrymans TaxID=341189 RepID=F8Q3U5_SERL3|nr:uncharacterized protein SERLADRAFT_473158 [Serpula lacrymans var. lacrymans S7.9]EGN96801.1 hypothetical protein SERLA73DRAFT_184963 [Serpula lacrymans var. lacrymans S7.3]EGO22400.1 hypothetical protein SERLADRAFT_473158 [Serpula lacrymans var. lacrymans S7.9]